MSEPHEAAPDENPEQHIGPEIADPWLDADQSDWETGLRPVQVVELPPWNPEEDTQWPGF
jgi:hypothetical protein